MGEDNKVVSIESYARIPRDESHGRMKLYSEPIGFYIAWVNLWEAVTGYSEGRVLLYVREGEQVHPTGSRGYRIVEVPETLACSRYIALFSKTPKDIVCPQFWELKWAVGCPYSCSYCYLQGTLYGRKSFRLKDLSKLEVELRRLFNWANEVGVSLLLNSGELSDSLAVPQATEKLLEILKRVLPEYQNHKVLIVTKAGLYQTAKFLKVAKGLEEYIIVSYSINARSVAKAYELAPPPDERLRAAKEVKERGFTVRLRLDPVIPVGGWKAEYGELVEDILMREVEPERITIGTLRGLLKTLIYSKDRRWVAYLRGGERTGWGLKLPPKLREEVYAYIIERLKEGSYGGVISLCKETRAMWVKLVKKGLLEDPGTPGVWELVRCNCKL